MAEGLRFYNGQIQTDTPNRSAVATADSAAADHATTLALAKVKCAGCDIVLTPSLNDSSATATLRVVWYDKDDEVIGSSADVSVAASTLGIASRFLGVSQTVVNPGAYAARVLVTVISSSDNVSVYVGTLDRFQSR